MEEKPMSNATQTSKSHKLTRDAVIINKLKLAPFTLLNLNSNNVSNTV